MHRYLVLFLLLLGFFYAEAEPRPLPDAWKHWLQSSAMRHSTVTLEVRDLTANSVVYAFDAERAVQPASVMKLVTTGAALRLLGAGHHADTDVLLRGEVDASGVLHGDVVLRGHGDAMLASMWSQYKTGYFAGRVVQALSQRGVRSVRGRIVGDGSALTGSPVPSDWIWEDLGNHYAPPIAGLNYGDNRVILTFDTSRPGTQPRLVRVTPQLKGVTFENCLLPVNYAFDSAYVYGAPYDAHRVIYGAIPHRKPEFSIKADVPDPAVFAASRIEAALLSAGISVQGQEVATSDSLIPIFTHRGEPLSYVVRQTNVNSLNLMAEMCLRQVAPSEDEGIRTVMRYWRDRGIDVSGVRMYDACGLAPTDRLTSHFICDLLAEMQGDTPFVQSLAVAGRTGTVHQFLKGTRLDGHAQLKTGTTKTVVAYAGYVQGADGHNYAIALFINNPSGPIAPLRKNIESLFLSLFP